jgi:hypothetical protein
MKNVFAKLLIAAVILLMPGVGLAFPPTPLAVEAKVPFSTGTYAARTEPCVNGAIYYGTDTKTVYECFDTAYLATYGKGADGSWGIALTANTAEATGSEPLGTVKVSLAGSMSIMGTNSEDFVIQPGSAANQVDFKSNTGVDNLNLPTMAITSLLKVLPIAADCTIGSTCDGTSARIARGGIILATAAVNITLPEIVASSPTASQVTIGASICIMSRDQNEVVTVHPNAADSFTPKDHAKQTAGNHMIETVSASTGAGNMICFLAAEADNWIQMGTIGTWDHE